MFHCPGIVSLILESYIGIQRCHRETPVGKKLSSRILVISSRGDSPAQYVATMNCIFAAQKNVSQTRLRMFEVCFFMLHTQSVPIDSCVLWEDSGFLQQVRLHVCVQVL